MLAAMQSLCRAPKEEVPALLERIVNGVMLVELEPWSAGVEKMVPCLRMRLHQGADPLLLVSVFSKESDGGAVLWREGGRWKAAVADLYGGTNVLGQFGKEYVLSTHMDGTGGYGRLVVVRTGPGGGQVFASETYSKFGAKMLDKDHYLLLYRDTQGAPMASVANCCIPGNGQTLVVRDGDGFKVAASRLVPSAIYTFDVFIGALRKESAEWLGRVATPEAVAAARTFHLEDPSVTWTYEMPEDILDRELYHWAALPAPLNGPAPTATTAQAIVARKGAPVARVTLTRADGTWRVTAVEAVKP